MKTKTTTAREKKKPTGHSGGCREKARMEARAPIRSRPKTGKRGPALTLSQLNKKFAAAKGNKYVPAAEARARRELLLRLRERITGQINFLATDNISRSETDTEISFRSEEQGTDNFDRDFALNRVSLDQDILFEIDEALNRLAMGAYGICESCGKGIEKARLKALPYSRMCVVCKSRNEGEHKKTKAVEAAAVFHGTDKAAEAAADEET